MQAHWLVLVLPLTKEILFLIRVVVRRLGVSDPERLDYYQVLEQWLRLIIPLGLDFHYFGSDFQSKKILLSLSSVKFVARISMHSTMLRSVDFFFSIRELRNTSIVITDFFLGQKIFLLELERY